LRSQNIEEKEINLNPSRERNSDGECLDPLGVVAKGTDKVARMFGTHDWDVNSSKPYGEGAVIIHYNCRRCNAEGYSIVTTKDSVMSKQIETRLLNPFVENPRI
jgi:hypothetical protein